MAQSDILDEMANIEALVKLNRLQDAKARANQWAENEPYNYRAHLSQALCEVHFFNYDPIELYFDRKTFTSFYNYTKNAQTVASESQCVDIYNTIHEYLDYINAIIKLHPQVTQLKIWERDEGARLQKKAESATISLKQKTQEVNDNKQKLQDLTDDLAKQYDKYDKATKANDELQEKINQLRANPPKGVFAFSVRKKYKEDVTNTIALINKNNKDISYLKPHIKNLVSKVEAEAKRCADSEAALNQLIQDSQVHVAEIERFNEQLSAKLNEFNGQDWKKDFYDRFAKEQELIEAKKKRIRELEVALRQSKESNETTARQFTEKYSQYRSFEAYQTAYSLFDHSERSRISRVVNRNREWREEIDTLTKEIDDTTKFLFGDNNSSEQQSA